MAVADDLRSALRDACAELAEHNAEYGHRTDPARIEAWARLAVVDADAAQQDAPPRTCPEHGERCGGAACCCADKHVEATDTRPGAGAADPVQVTQPPSHGPTCWPNCAACKTILAEAGKLETALVTFPPPAPPSILDNPDELGRFIEDVNEPAFPRWLVVGVPVDRPAREGAVTGPRAYYFGCWQRPGHGLHHVGGRPVHPRDGVPFDPFDNAFWLDAGPFDPFDNAFWLDAGLAPKRLGAGEERGTGRRAGDVFFALDGRNEDQRARLRRAGRELPQGEFLLHRFRGHTLIAWWDRSQGDTRGACNSVFIVEGDRTAAEMLELWPRCFPLQAGNLERAGIALREVRS